MVILLSFFIYFLNCCYVWKLAQLPQFSFHAVTKYSTLLAEHDRFFIWRKSPSSLSGRQETLGKRLLNTNQLNVHMWWCRRMTSDFGVNCIWDLVSCYHNRKNWFLIGKTSEHPTLFDTICYLFFSFYFSIIFTIIHYTHKHWQYDKNKNDWKTYKLQLTLDSKNCYQVWHIWVIQKVLKNFKNIVELAVNVEKSNCQRLARY